MSPETRRKRAAVRRHLVAEGYRCVGSNLYQRGNEVIDLDAAEMRDGRLRPRWAWIYDDHVAKTGPKRPGLDYEQGAGVRPLEE
jgi:hypothetical protein